MGFWAERKKKKRAQRATAGLVERLKRSPGSPGLGGRCHRSCPVESSLFASHCITLNPNSGRCFLSFLFFLFFSRCQKCFFGLLQSQNQPDRGDPESNPVPRTLGYTSAYRFLVWKGLWWVLNPGRLLKNDFGGSGSGLRGWYPTREDAPPTMFPHVATRKHKKTLMQWEKEQTYFCFLRALVRAERGSGVISKQQAF